MSRVCNNVDGKCYYINGGKCPSTLDNELGDPCYLPTSCPQNVNTPYEWIFQMPTPYTSLMELNDVTDSRYLNRWNGKYGYLNEPLNWVFGCDREL
jgi:hypothetical protein